VITRDEAWLDSATKGNKVDSDLVDKHHSGAGVKGGVYGGAVSRVWVFTFAGRRRRSVF